MALAYLFDPNKQFQDRNGVNNVSGFLRVYYEGTDDRATTYKNFIGTLNPADIPIDNDGRAVVIVDEEKTYRIEVYERNGNLQWTQHPVFPQVCGGSEYDGDVSNATATFTKDEEDTSEISSGSTLKVLFTKISMFFARLKRVAFTGSYNDLSDKPDIPSQQKQSNWTEQDSSDPSYIKNKPDLAQYIPKSQKGVANGVGTLASDGLQPFDQTYNGYFINNNVNSQKIVKIGRFRGGTTALDSGGASFSVVFRSSNQASGQALFWVQKGEYQTDTSYCHKVVLFNRLSADSTGNTGNSLLFFKDDVVVDGVNYVDIYLRMSNYTTARITPLWMNRESAQFTFSTESVELPASAVLVADSWFVRAPGEGAGDVSTPVFIAPNGVATPCTFVPAMSYGYKTVSKTVASGEENAITLSPAVELPTKRANWANAIITAELSVDPNGTSLESVSNSAKISIDIDGGDIETWVPVFVDGYFRKAPKTTFQFLFSPSLYPPTVTARVYFLNAPVGSIVMCRFHITLLSSNTNF